MLQRFAEELPTKRIGVVPAASETPRDCADVFTALGGRILAASAQRPR